MLGRSAAGLLALSGGTYGAIVASAAIGVVLSRSLGAEEYGRLALLLVAAQTLDLAVASWTLPVLVRSAAREWETTRTVASALTARTLVVLPPLAVALLLILFLAGPLMTYLAVGAVGLTLLVSYSFATALAQTGGALLRATDRMARQGLALLIEKGSLLMLVAAVAVATRPSAELALACYGISAVLAAVWSLGHFRPTHLRPAPPSRGLLRETADLSVPMLIGSFAGLFANQTVDLVAIRSFLPFADVGRYAVAYQVAGMVQQLLVVVSAFLLPRFVALLTRSREDLVRVAFERLVPYWLLAFSAACGVGILLAPVLVQLIFGPAFAGSVGALRILLVTASVFAVFACFNPLLVARGVVWPVTRAVIVAVTLNVVLVVLLVPVLGLEGAATATLISNAVSTGGVLAASHGALGITSWRYALFVLPAAAVEAAALALEGAPLAIGGLAAVAVTSAIVARVFDIPAPGDRALFGRLRAT